MERVIVVGGGASGMMAASIAAQQGKDVTLIERNEKLGKKLYITGKGRCNVTNSCDTSEMFERIPGNANFLYSALYTFPNDMLIDFFAAVGVKLKVERGRRVFPESDKSSDIIRALQKYLNRYGVNILLNTRVDDILIEGGTVKGVRCRRQIYPADAVIIATGGRSYPQTGSTGDGYEFARKAGHRVIKTRPSLVPVVVGQEYVKELQGLSLKNVAIYVSDKSRTIYHDFGEMLFTHCGLSGPMIISASRYIVDRLPGEIKVSINLKPSLTEEQLDRRLLRDFEKYSGKIFKNSLSDLLPQKMIPVIVKLSGIDEHKQVNAITREERRSLLSLIRNLTFDVTGVGSFNDAIITAGGVCVKEIDPSTMESKLVSGLYFTGEVLDVDALTGGFNLQIAFSTGYCAGYNC